MTTTVSLAIGVWSPYTRTVRGVWKTMPGRSSARLVGSRSSPSASTHRGGKASPTGYPTRMGISYPARTYGAANAS